MLSRALWGFPSGLTSPLSRVVLLLVHRSRSAAVCYGTLQYTTDCLSSRLTSDVRGACYDLRMVLVGLVVTRAGTWTNAGVGADADWDLLTEHPHTSEKRPNRARNRPGSNRPAPTTGHP
jgi:hypothetical protein